MNFKVILYTGLAVTFLTVALFVGGSDDDRK